MSNRPDSFMPLFIGDYLADTMHLTRDQHGGYLLLIMAYWRQGRPLANEDETLAAISKSSLVEWAKLRPLYAPFFQISEGLWRHKRVDQELEKASKRYVKAVAGAEAKHARKQKPSNEQAQNGAQRLLGACEPQPQPQENSPIGYSRSGVAAARVSTAAPPPTAGNLPGEFEPWLRLQEKLGPEQFRVWFGNCQTNGSETSIYAPSPFAKDQIESRFEGDFQECFGRQVRVHFDAKVWNPLAIAKAGVNPTTTA